MGMKRGKKSTGKKSNVQARKKKPSVYGIDLSVIIPAYNLEDCIADCLDSVLAQKIENIQITVVDDCSKDKTRDIIESYAEKCKQIMPVFFPVNKGVSAARNAALDAAKGEYIHFCDGDDTVPEGAYQELLRIAEEEDADLVIGNYSRRYPNEGNVVRPFSHYTAPTGIERCFESGNTMLWNKIYRRSLIERCHLRFEEDLKYYEDFLFYQKFVLVQSKAVYTDFYVYIYTEPLYRTDSGNIRYANLDCALGVDKAWRTIFSSDIQENKTLWQQAYQWNLNWYFTYSWKMIQDPEIRMRTFRILRELICWVQETVTFCSWFQPGRMQSFMDIFHVDYPTFYSIQLEDYLLHLAILDNIRPRAPIQPVVEDLKGLNDKDRDKMLAEEVKKQVEDLHKVYQRKYTNRYVWKTHYWNLLDSIVNDYWRQIIDEEEKSALFGEIRALAELLRTRNSLCSISTPDELWRFRQIFCMDNATLQMITASQYLMACAPRYGNSAEGSGSAIMYAPDPIEAFVNASRNGQVGMRAIFKAIKAWVAFKLGRRKR